MKWWQHIISWFLWLLATATAFLVPLYRIFDKLIIEHYEVTKARWSFSVAFVLIVLSAIGVKVLRAWYERKLQSMSVADELGVIGTTPIIIKRVLLLLQVAFPVGAFSLFLYGMTFIEIPSYKIFLEFVYWFIGGFVIYIAHDYLKKYFFDKNQIAKALRLDEKKKELAERRMSITQG